MKPITYSFRGDHVGNHNSKHHPAVMRSHTFPSSWVTASPVRKERRKITRLKNYIKNNS